MSGLRGHKLDIQGKTKEAARFKPGDKTGLQGSYLGQTPPGLEPKVFAPGIVSTAGNLEFAITFSPDGKEAYFTRRRDGGGQNTIMVSRREKDGWSAPEEAAFCKGFPSNEPHVTPDGNKLYFGCQRQQPGADRADYGIWVTERTAGDGWGELRYHGPGMYVSASRTGDLYMTDISNSAGGGIVRYPFAGGMFGQPEKLGGGVNAPRNGDHAFIAPDVSFIVFDSYYRPGGQGGEGDLWVSFKKADGSWTDAFNLGDKVNTPATNFCPSLSPDAALRRPLYELSFRGTAAILTIRGFGDDQEKGSLPYPEFLKNAFRTLEEKKTPNLIIDLRGNGGGRDEYGKLLFAYVMDRPFLYYKALETKKDHYDLFRFTDESKKDVEDLAKQVKQNGRGWFDVLGHPNSGLQQPENPGFTGRVAVLIDGLSFSATEETTSLFHFHKKAVFFGEECGAGCYGNASGFMVMATLPNTRIQIRIPLVLYTMAVDGYLKDRGIVPEVPVSPTIEDLLAGRDPVLERALQYLEKKEIQPGRRIP